MSSKLGLCDKLRYRKLEGQNAGTYYIVIKLKTRSIDLTRYNPLHQRMRVVVRVYEQIDRGHKTVLLCRLFLSLLSLNHINAFLDIYELLRQWWPGNIDMYEILDYESTWEMLDPEGRMAISRKSKSRKSMLS